MQMAECPPPVDYPMNILEIEPKESIRKYSIINSGYLDNLNNSGIIKIVIYLSNISFLFDCY